MTTASDTRAEASARLAGDDIEVIRDEPRPRDLRWFVLLAFVAVVGIAMWRHEMWRDELQAWMIARASHSVPNLLDNIRYEGHPALWYLLLLPLTKVSGSPWVMQVAQLAIATGALALVLWKAPFTRLQKVLFAGGYFVLFEYGTLSRSYSLGWLWLAATCVVASGKRRWPWAGVTLALLSLTSAFGALVAVGVLVGLLVDELVRRREREAPTALLPLVLGGIVAAAGLAVAYAQAAPPGDAGVYRSWNTSFNSSLVRTSLAAVSRALVPIPKFRREFWNTSVFDGITTPAAILGIAFVVGIAWLLRRKPGACAMWLAGVGLVVGFLYSKIQYASASRHYGHVFLVLIAVLWLAPSMTSWRGRDDEDERPARTRSKLWTAILVAQLVGGLFVLAVDLKYPFSNGRSVARMIDDRGLEHAIIVGEPDVSASTIAAYLDHDVYYAAGGRFGRYIIWDEDRTDHNQPLREIVRRLENASDEPVLVVSNHPIDLAVPGDYRLTPLAHFDNGIVEDEHFWVYRVVGFSATSR